MEESLTVQLRKLREEQRRLEQLLGHTVLETSFEASSFLHGSAQGSVQQRCVRELNVREVNTAAGAANTASVSVSVSFPAKGNSNNNGGNSGSSARASEQAQWTYQDRLKELEALKKKYEKCARASMNQYFNSVGDYEGYKGRRESRMKHVQPFTFESRELVKPPRIREQRAETDRQTREAALEEQRRYPLKPKPVPPSTFMNKYELMVEEWCQRKAAIELMSRERARLAKQEAEYVRISAQSLRRTREELMGVVYGPDGMPVTKCEQRRRAQSADARSGGSAAGYHHYQPFRPNEVPLEVKMKLWPALSDHERVRKERIIYRAAMRKIEVDEKVRQVLPLLTNPSPGRCYDAAAGVNPALLPSAGNINDTGRCTAPCFGVGQSIHPVNATQGTVPAATTAAGMSAPGGTASLAVSAVAHVPAFTDVTGLPAPVPVPVPLPPSQVAAPGVPLPTPPSSTVPAAPPATAGPVPSPPPSAIPPPSLPPTAASTTTLAVPAPIPPLPPPPPGAVVPAPSLAPHQSLSLFNSTVSTPPLGVGAPPVPTTTTVVPPTADGVSSGSSPSPLLSTVPFAVTTPAPPPPPPQPSAAVAITAIPTQPSSVAAADAAVAASTQSVGSTTALHTSTATEPRTLPVPPPPLPTVPPVPPPTAVAAGTGAGGTSVPPPSPTINPTTNATATSIRAGVPAAATTTMTSMSTTGGPAAVATTTNAATTGNTATSTKAVRTAPTTLQEEKEAIWRRYNPQLTFKPNIKPGVPNFEALWAKNNAELAEKKAHSTTTVVPFNLTPSARAEKVVGRRPTRSVTVIVPPGRRRSMSCTKKATITTTDGAAATAKPAAATAPASASSPPPPSLDDTRLLQKAHSSIAPRGTRAHALRTEAIYSNYVQKTEEHNRVAEADEQYWRAVAQRQREVRQRLAGYITDHRLEHERTIQLKVRALRASMKENEVAAEARLAEMRQRVAEMPPVFAEPVHLHEESKVRAEVEQNILQSLKDTGLDGATIKSILATSASNAENTDAVGAAATTAATPVNAAVVVATTEDATPAGEGDGDKSHSPTASAKVRNSQNASDKSSSRSSESSDSDSDSSNDSESRSSVSTRSSSSSPKKSSSAPAPSTSVSVSSVHSVPVPKPAAPKKDAEYSDDSFEDSSDSD